jgi:hypothetical protein
LIAPGQGWSRFDAAQKWTANGIAFIYYTSEGQGENAGRKHTMAFATIGEDDVTLSLQSPASIWPQAFDGLAALVASVRPIAQGHKANRVSCGLAGCLSKPL